MPLQNVLVNGATGSAGGGAAEVTLDIELMIALAPNASKILVYEGTNDDQGMLATYSKIASDNLAQIHQHFLGQQRGRRDFFVYPVRKHGLHADGGAGSDDLLGRGRLRGRRQRLEL